LPDTLVIGVDTNASGLVESSRRGLPNALFLIADASEALRSFLGRATEVHIVLPWASLLRSVLEGEREFALAVSGAL
jgi:hypothetical protein